MNHPPSGGLIDRSTLEDLAAANRILADKGIFDSAGHVSMRHPQAPERFLISRSIAPALVTPDDIMEHDLDCVPCEDRGRSSFLERFIHGEIYKARPDVMAVMHSHSASVISFSLTQTPLRATYHNASFLAAGVPVFDIRQKFGATDQVISDAARAAALAETLADKAVALLRAHGMVVVAPNLPSAVFRAIITEASARIQQNAIGLGGSVAYLDEEEGRLGDAVNLATVGRPWELWRRSVSF
jgi:HCOMODA/2-hydroxy-3-carboxy-muconic semialdehyde decarboxylase